MSGGFITFEGGEGAGKSTQISRLANRIKAHLPELVTTREPGGTPQGEALRSLLVNGAPEHWSAMSEALLNYAARDAHLRHVIRPALQRGATVICDRFMDSTRAYQGYAGGCDMHFIDELERNIVGATRPQLTLILDLDPEAGLARARARGDGIEDRYERKGLAFHRKLREAFRAIASADPKRCRLINADEPVEKVEQSIAKAYAEWQRG